MCERERVKHVDVCEMEIEEKYQRDGEYYD